MMEPEPQVTGQVVLPHHEQQPLCTTRLPYRQGRKLTAVKVYTINNESNHLLIFGVPSLNLRQEAKGLFLKFGKLLQFNISKDHPAEVFTETYHAAFERIQSARVAKKMLDTKNFYGGSLHVCYAPEFENIDETRSKLLQRQKDVLFRLRNLQKEAVVEEKTVERTTETVNVENDKKTLYMGDVNTIRTDNNIVNAKKRKKNSDVVIEKKFKPCFVSNNTELSNNANDSKKYDSNISNYVNLPDKRNEDNIELIDFTSTEQEAITNINESLNYNKFGNEIIRKIPVKPLNRIKFIMGNKT